MNGFISVNVSLSVSMSVNVHSRSCVSVSQCGCELVSVCVNKYQEQVSLNGPPLRIYYIMKLL